MPKNDAPLDPQESLASLRNIVAVDSTIYGQFIHVNFNATTRIYVFFVVHNGELFQITQEVASACNLRYRTSSVHADGIDVGSDDGSRVIQRLSSELFGDPKKLSYRKFI